MAIRIDSKTFWQKLQPMDDCYLITNENKKDHAEGTVAVFNGIDVIIDNTI